MEKIISIKVGDDGKLKSVIQDFEQLKKAENETTKSFVANNEKQVRSVRTMKKELREMKLAIQDVAHGTDEWKKLAKDINKLDDDIGDIEESFKTLKGQGVEPLTNSFSLLKEGMAAGDFDKVKTAMLGVKNSVNLTTIAAGAMGAAFSFGLSFLLTSLPAIIDWFKELAFGADEIARIDKQLSDLKAELDVETFDNKANALTEQRISNLKTELELLKLKGASQKEVEAKQNELNAAQAQQDEVLKKNYETQRKYAQLEVLLQEEKIFQLRKKYKDVDFTEFFKSGQQYDIYGDYTSEMFDEATKLYLEYQKSKKELEKIDNEYNASLLKNEDEKNKALLAKQQKTNADIAALLNRRKQIEVDMQNITNQILSNTEKLRLENLQDEKQKELQVINEANNEQSRLLKEQNDKLQSIISNPDSTKQQREAAKAALSLLSNEALKISENTKQKELAVEKKYNDLKNQALLSDIKQRNEREASELKLSQAKRKNQLEDDLQNVRKDFEAQKITKEQFDEQTKKLNADFNIEISKQNLNASEAALLDLYANKEQGLIDDKQFGDERIKLETQIENDILNLKKASAETQNTINKNTNENAKKTLEQFAQFQRSIFQSLETQSQSNIDVIKSQQGFQQQALNTQLELAKAGRENTLAFEEKRMRDLQQQQLDEQQRLKKIKELEIFLNAVASFSKDNPNTAIGKAFVLLAGTKIAEAQFMEEGGVAGERKNLSTLSTFGFSKRHKSGRDVLVQAEVGETMFSVNDSKKLFERGEIPTWAVKRMSSEAKKKILNQNINSFSLNTKGLEDRLDRVERAIVENRDTIDFDGMANMIVTRTRAGIKDVTKYLLK